MGGRGLKSELKTRRIVLVTSIPSEKVEYLKMRIFFRP